ncbi:MAG TPA: disulfide bond formation protein B, partial [Cellvibrionaceae bacterium]
MSLSATTPSWRRPLDWANTRSFWLATALICAALEAGALFYQYVLGDPPCEICIYIRVWLFALLMLSLLALPLRRWRFTRLLSAVAGLLLAVGLAHETWIMVQIEYNIGSGGSCGFFANFPAWAPLDKWLPFLFEVQGLCMATPKVLFGLTMVHGLIAVSAVFIIAF